MKLLYLTEKCNMIINTENEATVLTRMIRDHKISEAKINGTYIYLCSDPLGRPDVDNGKVRVLLKYLDKTHNLVEEMTWIDIVYTMGQINGAELSSERDGNFSYIDWDEEYMVISSNQSAYDCTYRLQFKLNTVPELDNREVIICGETFPRVDNIGYENSIFNANIRSKFNDNKIRLTVDMKEPLDSTIEIL